MTAPTVIRTPDFWPRATRALSRSDPVMRSLVRAHRGLALGMRGDAFQTLARAIVGQQISVKAADSVWTRFVAHVGVVAPGPVAAATADALRACGLSRGKAAYIGDLARRFEDGSLDATGWPALGDEALITELTQVKGIGRWTAEMFMIFHLARPDVLPVADLGLQKAMRIHYNNGRPLSERRLRALAAPWVPWRSVATWYLWRSLDPVPVEY
jgi:DNA-3-methyladenine glycosylase II